MREGDDEEEDEEALIAQQIDALWANDEARKEREVNRALHRSHNPEAPRREEESGLGGGPAAPSQSILPPPPVQPPPGGSPPLEAKRGFVSKGEALVRRRRRRRLFDQAAAEAANLRSSASARAWRTSDATPQGGGKERAGEKEEGNASGQDPPYSYPVSFPFPPRRLLLPLLPSLLE
jgi:hypothetical protein